MRVSSGATPSFAQAARKMRGSGFSAPTSYECVNASTRCRSPFASKIGTRSRGTLLTTPTFTPRVRSARRVGSVSAYGIHRSCDITRSYRSDASPGATRSARSKSAVQAERCRSSERSRPLASSSGVLPAAQISSHSARASGSSTVTPRSRAASTITRAASGLEKSVSPQSNSTARIGLRSEEHTSELQSRLHLVCRLLLEKKKKVKTIKTENKLKYKNRNTLIISHYND